jgi:hypothetical protein
MRNSVHPRPSWVAIALLGVGCLVGRAAAAAPPLAPDASPPTAESRDRKPASSGSAPADRALELLAAVQALSAQVEEQTKLIGQLQRRLDDYGKQINGRLMATCLAAMTAVPSPDWGLPIGRADKAAILAACSNSDGWKATHFDATQLAFDVFAPFR